MTVLAHRSLHRNTGLDSKCLLCGAKPEIAPHPWACWALCHERGPARQRLADWPDQKVGERVVSVRHPLWEPVVKEQSAAALRTPSMQRARMERSPHTLGTYFTSNVIEDSIRVWYAHAKARATSLKAPVGPSTMMALVLQELRLQRHAERVGVQFELLG